MSRPKEKMTYLKAFLYSTGSGLAVAGMFAAVLFGFRAVQPDDQFISYLMGIRAAVLLFLMFFLTTAMVGYFLAMQVFLNKRDRAR